MTADEFTKLPLTKIPFRRARAPTRYHVHGDVLKYREGGDGRETSPCALAVSRISCSAKWGHTLMPDNS